MFKILNDKKFVKNSLFSRKNAFTLAEIMITLSIIGVIAAITIPGVVINTNQSEYRTGLRKAVSVLNQAITASKALTGETPYTNTNLFPYLTRNLSVMSRHALYKNNSSSYVNAAFYTTDGLRYEIAVTQSNPYKFKLYERPTIYATSVFYDKGMDLKDLQYILSSGYWPSDLHGGECGSYGLANNPDNTTNPPCIITVDVNGDRKPSPTSVSLNSDSSKSVGAYKYADPSGVLMTDVFSIMITDSSAIPYGIVAQKAMYEAQK